MKKLRNPENLPLAVALLGAAAALTRGAQYLTAVDDRGLLTAGHLSQWLLTVLTAAVAVLVLAAVWKQKGSNRFEDNFIVGSNMAIGSWILAVGIALTLLAGNTMGRPILVLAWRITGAVSALALLLAGWMQAKGKRPFLLTYAVFCLFLALHMVSRYQVWSGNPQVQDWAFSLLGAVGLTLCAYHHSAFAADMGKRRSLLAVSLLTVFACLAALPYTEYTALYLCGGIWAYTGLCRVRAVPEKTTEKE